VPYESKPCDGTHPTTFDPQGDWRTGWLDRLFAYGNYAGFDNRNLREGGYHPPIDGIDAAAQRHDAGYAETEHEHPAFTSWDGIRATTDDDRRFVEDVEHEMAVNGACYSEKAEGFSRGARGLFGGRVMGMEAVDWAKRKRRDAQSGVVDFLHEAEEWDDLGDVARGLGSGADRAGSWMARTGREAWEGVSRGAQDLAELGPRGVLNGGLGLLDVGVIGTGHALHRGWDWLTEGPSPLEWAEAQLRERRKAR
jgi:hypothetical protein